jgi:hypothetical protein
VGESAVITLIACIFTLVGVLVTAIFAFAGKRAELAQRALDREIQTLRDQVAATREERDHYRDRLDSLRFSDEHADHRRWTDPGNKDAKRKPDTGKRRRFDDDPDV